MRTSRMWLLGTLVALSFRPAIAQTTDNEQAMKVAQSVVDSYVAAFNKHDAKAISMLFVPDGVFLPPMGGAITKGRDAIERSWAGVFKSIGGSETIAVKDAMPLGDDVVVAVNEFKIIGDDPNKGFGGRAMIVLTKTPDGWRYAAITPQVAPPPTK